MYNLEKPLLLYDTNMHTRTINSENVLEVLSDGLHIFVIRNTPTAIQIEVLTKYLDNVGLYELRYRYNPHVRGAVDNDAIYLPTMDGVILCLDKFSGEIFARIETYAQFLVCKPKIDDDYLYALGSVPVSTGHYIKSNILSVSKYDKKSGKKVWQSRSLPESEGLFSIYKGSIHIAAGQQYLSYSEDHHENQVQLSRQADYEPLIAHDSVYIASKSGTLDVIEHGKLEKYFFAANATRPLFSGGSLFWLTGQGLFQFANKHIEVVYPLSKRFMYANLITDAIFGFTEDSELFIFENGVSRTIVGPQAKRIAFPQLVDRTFIVQLDSMIYSMEIQ